MAFENVNAPPAVQDAVKEFDRMGRDAFIAFENVVAAIQPQATGTLAGLT